MRGPAIQLDFTTTAPSVHHYTVTVRIQTCTERDRYVTVTCPYLCSQLRVSVQLNIHKRLLYVCGGRVHMA